MNKFAKKLPTMAEFDEILKQTGEYVQALDAKKVHLILMDIREPEEM